MMRTKYPARLNAVTDNNRLQETKQKGNAVTRKINRCLTPCDKCTGSYIDSISGNVLRITCHHSCHLAKKKHGESGKECRELELNPYQSASKPFSDKSGSGVKSASRDCKGIVKEIKTLAPVWNPTILS